MPNEKIDPLTASAMQKITRRSYPVRVLRRVHALATAKADLDALKQAVAGTSGFLAPLLEKMGRGGATALKERIKQQKRLVSELEADWIEGELTPLSEAEVWGVRAHYTHMEIFLRKQMRQEETTPEKKAANEAAEQAANIIGTQVWMSKWIGYSLKRKTAQGLEPYWTNNEVPAEVEAKTIAQLFNLYHAAFTLTDDELKKSVAPKTPIRN